MRIAVIGTGYVGLVAGTCFAESGNTVTCVDVDADKVRKLKDGVVPIYEPGLEELLKRNVHDGRLHFTTEYEEAVPGADAVFIAVGTPPDEDGSADLKYVLAAAETIAKTMDGYTVIVDKSTVPVGTARKVQERAGQHTSHPFDVVSNPEFLKEGAAIDDFLKPDRVVIGSESSRAAEVMDELYAPFVRTGNPIIHMDIESAELTKYAANAMLATRISFMNEIANICMKVGANVDHVRKGIGSDARIGSRFLFAGLGYGGSCFPKDVKALVHTGREHGLELELAATTDRVNDRQKGVLFRKLKAHFDDDLRGKRIAVWGVAFKPRTDDIRESASLTLMDALLADGATIVAHDPEAEENAKQRYGDRVSFVEDAYDAAKDADALCLMTEWRQYQNPDFDRLKELMRRPLVVDGRNIWSTYGLRAQGFTYDGIGVRGS